MKNPARLLAILTLSAVFSGCMSSLNPFYLPGDIYSDRNLVGTWKATGEAETWKFEDLTGGKYRVTHTDEAGTRSLFEATLFRIADDSFIDLLPVSREDTAGELHRSLTATMHLIAAIKVEPNTAQVATLNETGLKDLLARGQVSLGHGFLNGEIVITDKTENVRAFLAANAKREGVFDSWAKLEKVGAKK